MRQKKGKARRVAPVRPPDSRRPRARAGPPPLLPCRIGQSRGVQHLGALCARPGAGQGRPQQATCGRQAGTCHAGPRRDGAWVFVGPRPVSRRRGRASRPADRLMLILPGASCVSTLPAGDRSPRHGGLGQRWRARCDFETPRPTHPPTLSLPGKSTGRTTPRAALACPQSLMRPMGGLPCAPRQQDHWRSAPSSWETRSAPRCVSAASHGLARRDLRRSRPRTLCGWGRFGLQEGGPILSIYTAENTPNVPESRVVALGFSLGWRGGGLARRERLPDTRFSLLSL